MLPFLLPYRFSAREHAAMTIKDLYPSPHQRLRHLRKMHIDDLRKFDVVDLASEAIYTSSAKLMRKSLSLAKTEMIKRHVTIKFLREQLSHANAMVDELKKNADLTAEVTATARATPTGEA
jgi:hypothetical protein